MEPYLSGLFALGGTLVGGLVTFGVQTFAQRREDARHRQKLAYETAVKAWEFWSRFKLNEIATKGGNEPQAMPCMNHFLVAHIRLAEFLSGTDLRSTSDATLAKKLASLAERDDVLIALLLEESARRQQKTPGSV